MSIVEFLKATIEGNLSLDEQKQYLKENAFPAPEEIAEAVEYLYTQMSPAPKLPGSIDICGTGGSGLARLNTSTISSFIIAGAGVKLAKHGNNAASGKFGSFDLLNALDVPASLSAQQLQLRFNDCNLAFLYAKSFHPIMRFFAPVRAELKQATFFNILGPLLSPVRSQRQLIGTPKPELAQVIAEVAKALNKERVIVATGSDGLDEVTLNGKTHIIELAGGKIKEYDLIPEDFGIEPINDFSEIATKDPKDNTEKAKAILKGSDQSRRTDLVLVNSAMALYLAGKSDDLKECYKLAKQSLESGKALKILEEYRKPGVLMKIIARDKQRDFNVTDSLKNSGKKYTGGLIAEVKRKSPSEGKINEDIDVMTQVRMYEQAGASAISVLTEPEDFGGSFKDLKEARKATDLPILCKDFIAGKDHIDKAKSCGADMVLLIAAVLEEDKLAKLHDHALKSGLQPLVEVHTFAELDKVLKLKPKIIGINSRNLHDFSLNPKLFNELAGKIPEGVIKVAESGINHYRDIPKDYQGILVGTVLMRHPFARLKIKELLGKPVIKLCGIRETKDAELCEELGADLIGVNFVPRSKRKVDIDKAKQLVNACNNTITVGIFEDQPPGEVNKIAAQTGIKAIQLSGSENNLNEYDLPVIKTIRLGEERPDRTFLTIIDGPVPGSGKKIDYDQLDRFTPSLIAGGVDRETAKGLLSSKKPLGIDTASGIETNGQVDPEKIKQLMNLVSSIQY